MADPTSQYLIQALQQGGQQPQGSTYQGPNLQQMQGMMQQKQAWEAQNPGQSYMGHGLQQLGQNLMNAPGKLVQGAQNLAGLPGQAMGGLQNLMKGLPGLGSGQSQPGTSYPPVPRGADGQPLLGGQYSNLG